MCHVFTENTTGIVDGQRSVDNWSENRKFTQRRRRRKRRRRERKAETWPGEREREREYITDEAVVKCVMAHYIRKHTHTHIHS